MVELDSAAELPVAKTRLRRLALHNVRHHCGTAITCRYHLPPSLTGVDMHKEVVRRFENAVAQTIPQFPMQVGLIGESTRKPSWDKQYKATLLYQLDAKFEHLETRPGWRRLLMRTEADDFVDIMFIWNHANCDGMRGTIFHLSLLQSLHRPASWGPFKLAKQPITLGFAFSQVWHTFGPSLLSSKSAKATCAPLQLGSYASQATSFNIQNEALGRILAASCLACCVPQGKARDFTAARAMDQRRFMCPRKGNGEERQKGVDARRSVQNCVSSIHHTFGYSLVADIRAKARTNNWEAQPIRDLEKEIWSASRVARGDIEERLNAGLKNNIVGLMKLVHDWQEYHGDQAKRDRELSWIVTNLGVIDGESEVETAVHGGNDRWSINQANFALSAHVAGPFVQISTPSIEARDLSVTLSRQEPIEGNETCARLAQGVEAWLRFLGQ
ncbi:hypothetical protein EDB81DRAFT_919924 [Dactylonectria macrodidyma]|uniref:Uncharacterized protein n=1 Tax=Dactylonectria macrodidyma TaxID=307937 RepID=A0A9P9D9C5_9HYPO|nr:hypothetical protein EDB81DRAFT_919924 [Dactylonectria macrodidyma]